MDCEHLEPEILNTAVGEIRDQYLSSKKAEQSLGWKPVFDLETGLRKTIDWYLKFFAEEL